MFINSSWMENELKIKNVEKNKEHFLSSPFPENLVLWYKYYKYGRAWHIWEIVNELNIVRVKTDNTWHTE